MTGQINVNKIAARTGTTITIDTGDALDVTLVKSEGSATTNLKKGLAKAWFAQMDASGQSVNGDSLNYSSYTDPGTGRSQVTVTNAMAAVNCCVVGSSHIYDYGHYQVSTTQFIYASVNSGGTYTDNTTHGLVFGVLA